MRRIFAGFVFLYVIRYTLYVIRYTLYVIRYTVNGQRSTVNVQRSTRHQLPLHIYRQHIRIIRSETITYILFNTKVHQAMIMRSV